MSKRGVAKWQRASIGHSASRLFFGAASLVFCLALSACTPAKKCTPDSPPFQLGSATYRIPRAYTPQIFNSEIERRVTVLNGVRSVTYCATASKVPVIAHSVMLDRDSLVALRPGAPELAGVSQVVWRESGGGLTPPQELTPSITGDGFARYQAKADGPVLMFEIASPQERSPIAAICFSSLSGSPTRCRVYGHIPGKFATQLDVTLEQAPPNRWVKAIEHSEEFLESYKE